MLLHDNGLNFINEKEGKQQKSLEIRRDTLVIIRGALILFSSCIYQYDTLYINT